jgi:hypothetical protein
MKKSILRRNAYLPGTHLDVFDIMLVDLIPIVRQNYTTTIVETLDVGARHRHIDAANHHIALLLGIYDRFMHTFHCGLEIDDLTLADAARGSLSDPEKFDCAVGATFPDDYTDF